MYLIILRADSVISLSGVTPGMLLLRMNKWIAFFNAAVLQEIIYLQGCKHTLCLEGICLGNWEKWRVLLQVLSPTFHIDLQASLQNCFSLNNIKQKEKKCQRSKFATEMISEQNKRVVMGITCCVLFCCPRQAEYEKTCNNWRTEKTNKFIRSNSD